MARFVLLLAVAVILGPISGQSADDLAIGLHTPPAQAKPAFEWVDGVKQHPDYRFKITTDRDPPVYHAGEIVTFTLSATHKGQPIDGKDVKWFITNDGLLPALQAGKVVLTNGQAVFSGSLKQPGFLQCRVDFSAPGESVPGAKAAAAFDPLEIKPSLPAPDDFNAFWDSQKKLVKETPANVKITSVKSPVDGVECFNVQADCPEGANFSAYMARPIGAKPGLLPAIVCTQGAGVASSRLSIVAGWAKDGLLALDFNVHGLPNGQPQAFYSDLYKGPLKGYFTKNPDSRETLFGRVMYHRLLRALEIVTSQLEWNGKQLIAHGRSQGGGQAIAAAGLDPRVTLMCAQIPVFCDNTGMILGRSSGSHGIVAMDEKGVPNPKALEAVRYYDGTNWAMLTKAEGFFTVGFIDTSCPPTGIYAVYNLWAGKKDILAFYRWGHIAAPEGDEAVRKKVLAHIGRTVEEISSVVSKKAIKQQTGEE